MLRRVKSPSALALFLACAVFVLSAEKALASSIPLPEHAWAAENNLNDSGSIGGITGTNVGGVTFAAGKVGQAFSFNSSGNNVNMGANVGNFGTADFSIASWVKASAGGVAIFSKRQNSINFANMYLQGGTGKLIVEVRDNGSGSDVFYSFVGTQNLADGQWHHIVLTRQGATMVVYVDGALASGSGNSPGLVNLSSSTYTSTPFVVGLGPGLIDELGIYGSALSGAQVQSLYASPLPEHAWAAENNFTDSGSIGGITGTNVGGVTFGTGKVGQAFSLSGSSQSIDLGAGVGNFGTADFSLSVWMKPIATGSNEPVLVKRAPDSGGIFNLTVAPDGTLLVEIRDNGGGSDIFYSFTGTQNLADGQWHHLALTRQGRTIAVYVDGSPALGAGGYGNSPSGVLNLSSANYTAQHFIIGTNPFSQYYKGLIDEFNVYGSALSSAQVQSLYASAAGTAPTATYTLTASAGANGSITPSGAVSVNQGANQSFTIVPASGYHVQDVLVDGSSVGAVTSYSFTNVTANHTIAASFAIDVNAAPTLVAIANPAAINEDAGAQTVGLTGISAGPGETQTLTVTATSSNTALIPNPTVTYTSANTTGSLSYTPVANASGTATITVTVTDNGGTANGGINTVSQTFAVTVNPVNDAPTLAAIPDPAAIPANAGLQTLSLSGIGAGPGETQVLAVTATSGNTALIPNPTVTYTSPGATGTLNYTPVANSIGTAVITVTVTDGGGTASGGINTVSQSFTVTVNKASTTTSLTETPGIAAGFGAPVTFTATVSPATATGTVTFFDGQTSLGTGTLSGGQASLSTAALGVGIHSITAVYAGNASHLTSTSAVLTETITDTTPPVVTAPADRAFQAGLEGPPYQIGTAIATDDVGVVSLTNDAPASYTLGTTYTVTWTAKDAAGNIGTATQRVLVQDTVPPTLTVPADVTVEATGPNMTIALGTATASDAGSPPVTITNNAPSSFSWRPDPIFVVWTATDASNNSVQRPQKVTITDLTPPVVTAPPDVTVEDTGALTAVDLGGFPTWTDNVGVASTTNDAPVAGFPVGTTTVTWTVKDPAGNAGTATQKVTVIAVDRTPPVVTVPPPRTFQAGFEAPYILQPPTATDDVGVVSLTNDAPASYTLGTTYTVTWTAKDAAGNIGTATQRVLVQDTVPPTLTVPADVTVEATGPNMTIALGTATASDAGRPPVTITNNAPSSFSWRPDPTFVVWTATDASNNSVQRPQKVTITDLTPPVVTAPADVSVNAAGVLTAVDLGGFPTWTDNVGAASTTNDAPVAGFPVGTTTVTWTVKDPAGNAGTATQKVVVNPVYSITATVGANGAVSPAGATSVNSGGSQAYTITADAGYHVADVQVDGTSVLAQVTNDGYTFTNVQASHTINATFARDNRPPTLNVPVGQTVDAGRLLTFGVSGSDPDGQLPIYTATSVPAGASFNPGTQIFRWKPALTQAGTYTVSFRVSDGSLSDTKTVQITVKPVVSEMVVGEVPVINWTTVPDSIRYDQVEVSRSWYAFGTSVPPLYVVPQGRSFNGPWPSGVARFSLYENCRLFFQVFGRSAGSVVVLKDNGVQVATGFTSPSSVILATPPLKMGIHYFTISVNGGPPPPPQSVYCSIPIFNERATTVTTKQVPWVSYGGRNEVRAGAPTGYPLLRSSPIYYQNSYYNTVRGETRPAVGDLDGDGYGETVMGAGAGSNGNLETFTSSGAHKSWLQIPWPAYNTFNGETRPALGDLNGDGQAEVVAGLGKGGQGYVYVGNASGFSANLQLPAVLFIDGGNYNATDGHAGETRPAVGDLDGDGIAEIVVGLGKGGGDRLAVYASTPTGFKFRQWLTMPRTSATGETRPAIGDIDGDGKAEIVVGQADSPAYAVFGYTSSGYVFKRWIDTRLNWGGVGIVGGWPAVGDMDGNGRAETLIGGSGNGVVLIYEGGSLSFVGPLWTAQPFSNIATGNLVP